MSAPKWVTLGGYFMNNVLLKAVKIRALCDLLWEHTYDTHEFGTVRPFRTGTKEQNTTDLTRTDHENGPN
jgi:hypothetical protein